MAVNALFNAIQSDTLLLRCGVTRTPRMTGWSMPTVNIPNLFINVLASSVGVYPLTDAVVSGWVKASDVADNMSRLKGLDQETQFRLVVKYANAIDILARKGYYAGRFM